jgi:hypothetical protein
MVRYNVTTTYAVTNQGRINKGNKMAGIAVLLFFIGLILLLVQMFGEDPLEGGNPVMALAMLGLSLLLVLIGIVMCCVGSIMSRTGMKKVDESWSRR